MVNKEWKHIKIGVDTYLELQKCRARLYKDYPELELISRGITNDKLLQRMAKFFLKEGLF